MSDKHFPPMMSLAMREAEQNNKKTWPGWGDKPEVCPNCEGWGFFSLTVALAGPFNNPTQGHESTMSDRIDGRTVWYSVKTTAYQCPDCQGGTRVYAGQQRPVERAVRELVQDYTDR